MLIKNALHWAHEQLVLSSDSARLDAEVLLGYVLEKPMAFLISHDDDEVGFWPIRAYRRLIEQRKKGMPVAYLIGTKEFYGLDFEVNENVLIPRPDTEVLVESVIEYTQSFQRRLESYTSNAVDSSLRWNDILFLDVGTGSACIPISILKNLPGIKALATEISSQAMKVASKNIRTHGMEGRIALIQSDLLKNLPSDWYKGKEVVVTANLPYIPQQFQVHPSTKFEPDLALYGGEDGLDIYKRLFEELAEVRPQAIFVECFDFQKAILATHLPDYELKYVKNMTGDARCLFFERK